MNTKNRIYLDHNATSPLRPEVQEELQRVLGRTFNPSSLHQSGRKSRKQLDEARENIASLIGASASEIIFTSGGTESNHLAWNAFRAPGKKILTTQIEHPCVLDAAHRAETAGAQVAYLKTNREGETESPVSHPHGPDFLSIQHANNEIGTLHPVETWTKSLRAQEKVWIHTDAVQSAGKRPISVRDLHVDYLSLSGHKMGALPGCGALYVKRGAPFSPLWGGGSQERQKRSGTENVLGILSLGIAAKLLQEIGEAESRRIQNLRDHFEREMEEKISDIRILAQDVPRLSNTSCILFSDTDAESIMMAADLEGLDCSTGAACSSGSLDPSHVLTAMSYSVQEAKSCVRFSLGWNTAEEDVKIAIRRLKKVVEQVRSRVD